MFNRKKIKDLTCKIAHMEIIQSFWMLENGNKLSPLLKYAFKSYSSLLEELLCREADIRNLKNQLEELHYEKNKSVGPFSIKEKD